MRGLLGGVNALSALKDVEQLLSPRISSSACAVSTHSLSGSALALDVGGGDGTVGLHESCVDLLSLAALTITTPLCALLGHRLVYAACSRLSLLLLDIRCE